MAKSVLTIDTASPFCSVALHDGASLTLSEVSTGEGNHFEQLSGLVATLLSKAAIAITEVDSIGVGVGPGSFTGIRIGMSFAKGVAWANQVPLVGFCSLAACGACALNEHKSVSKVAVISDAGRDELFLGVFEQSTHGPTNSAAPVLNTFFNPAIVARKDLSAHLVGVSMVASAQEALLNSSLLKEVLPQSIGTFLVREPALGGLVVANFGAAALEQGSLGAIQLEPVYLRQVAAKTIAERLAEAQAKNTARN